jgi:glucuronoarabinoxylan endo-1,4-beta-xylanase
MKSKNLFLLYSVVVLVFLGGYKAYSQVTIDGNVRYQMIDGFGFSSAWCGTLSSAKNNALYDSLGMSLLRIRIDPTRSWSAETANAAAAHAAGAKVLGTPWSPPASMKTNNNVVHGSLSTDQYHNYALYLNEAANNIGLDYVSLQNEPDWDPDYEGCSWNGTQFLNFIKNYGQSINKPLVMPEAVHFNNSLSDPTLNDSTAASHMSILAGHFYGGGNIVHQNALDKGKRVWMTEHFLDGRDSIPVCMELAVEINQALSNWFSAYIWWWVNDGSNLMNPVDNSGTIYKNGYVMGQFAKFIRPGMQRIEATYNPTSDVYVTAYVNNGLTIVAINTSTSSKSQDFILQNLDGVGSFNLYQTSGSQNMAQIGNVNLDNRSFSLNLPPQSITTLVLAKGANPDDIWLEAEFRTMGSLWETHSDSTASNGKHVTVQSGYNSTDNAPTDTSGYITYGFKINESGTYTVWGRVKTPTTDDDAFWVKMDSEAWFSWDSITPSTSWTWAKIDTFALNEGGHSFTVAYKKDGALLDKLFITRTDSIPSGMGGLAYNTSPSNTSPIANAGTAINVVDSDGSGTETILLNGIGSIDHDGFIVSYEWREGDSIIATGATESVDFSVGIHNITLTVTDNEGATGSDNVELTIYSKNYLDSNLGLEPECGIVGANWEIIDDAQTSNGYYVAAKPGFESKDQAPDINDGLISISFNVEDDNNYYLFARLYCPTADDDSYWIKMDDGSFSMHNNLNNSDWGWVGLGNYPLTAGEHTLTIGYREDGANLDKLIVSRYDNLPESYGIDAVNACESPTVDPPVDTSTVVDYISENDINFSLKQIYPNPFNMTTVIKYDLKDAGHVKICVYNLVGHKIETVVDKDQPVGEYNIVWQAGDLPGGIYFCIFKVGETIETRKLIIQK